MEVCPYCKTKAEEILKTGFVGCEKCYLLPSVKEYVNLLSNGKTHKKGREAEIGKF